jgi:hypothetical protein
VLTLGGGSSGWFLCFSTHWELLELIRSLVTCIVENIFTFLGKFCLGVVYGVRFNKVVGNTCVASDIRRFRLRRHNFLRCVKSYRLTPLRRVVLEKLRVG